MDYAILFLATCMPSGRDAREWVRAYEYDDCGHDVFRVRQFIEFRTPVHFVASRETCVVSGEDTFMTTSHCRDRAPKMFSRSLRTADKDTENAFVLVGGHATFWRACSHVDEKIRRRVEGARDCFVVWGRENGTPLCKSAHADVVGRDVSGPHAQLYVSTDHAIRGVVFFREILFDADGVASYVSRVIRIRVRRRDTSAEQVRGVDTVDFATMVSQKTHIDSFGDESFHFEGWNRLVSLAIRGFNSTCVVNELPKVGPRKRPKGSYPPLRLVSSTTEEDRFLERIKGMSERDALLAASTVDELRALGESRITGYVSVLNVVYAMIGRLQLSDEEIGTLYRLVHELEASEQAN